MLVPAILCLATSTNWLFGCSWGYMPLQKDNLKVSWICSCLCQKLHIFQDCNSWDNALFHIWNSWDNASFHIHFWLVAAILDLRLTLTLHGVNISSVVFLDHEKRVWSFESRCYLVYKLRTYVFPTFFRLMAVISVSGSYFWDVHTGSEKHGTSNTYCM